MNVRRFNVDVPVQDVVALGTKLATKVGVKMNNTVIVFSFLGLWFLGAALGYFITTASIMEKSYNISALNRDISLERDQSKALQITLSEGRDLPRLLDRTSSLLYTEIQRMNYVERPNTSPFGLAE